METKLIDEDDHKLQEEPSYDRAKEVKDFDETKAGVQGLVDSGIVSIPKFFLHPPERLPGPSAARPTCFRVPVIDFGGYDGPRRPEIVKQIGEASATWGFFQMVNHGVPVGVLDSLLQAIKEFHEQPKEVKKEWYSRDRKVKVRYYSNGDLFVSKAADWRDTLVFDFRDGPLTPEAYPLVCRDVVSQYVGHMIKLRESVSELLSEALGLRSDYLKSIEFMGSELMGCHYYPTCPEPDLTLGATKHSDPSCLTFVLQDSIGGLQVLHQDHWVDVNPLHGALVTNIGDFLQIITNDKFKSVEHRVLAGLVGPRVSAACFCYPSARQKFRPFGPIKGFTSQENPPKYRETHISEYLAYYKSKGLDGNKALPNFRL